MPSADRDYIESLFRAVLGRQPTEDQISRWLALMADGLTDREVFDRFVSSKEYRKRVVPGHPVGHYYSPVVDPEEVRRFRPLRFPESPEDIPGVRISLAEMRRVWDELEPHVATSDFPEDPDGARRYYRNNPIYPAGDAAILRAMIRHLRPRRIIEVGSGLSSACTLDTLDEMTATDTEVTFIEPYPERLKEHLEPRDFERCEIIQSPVQVVDPRLFDRLEKDDILLIDSTHVMKTGSDVNFELFEILPRLARGVMIHFHDIHYPFEYPDAWVLEKRYSWNEIYGLRAFLMYNEAFQIEYFTSLFHGRYRDLVAAAYPPIPAHPGASLWIRKV